jgi:hypothetical protein
VITLTFDVMDTRLTHGRAYVSWPHGMAEFVAKMVISLLRKLAASVGFEGLSGWPN